MISPALYVGGDANTWGNDVLLSYDNRYLAS